MAHYKFLVLNGEDNSLTYDTFTAGSDRLAWEHVRARFTSALKMELWCHDRLVAAPERSGRR